MSSKLTKDLTSFHLRIDQSVKNILKDGKIDAFDIPEIILLVTELIITPSSGKISADMLEEQISSLYEYIMNHYKLFPEDETQKTNFERLFNMSVNLVLIQPNIKNACKSCLY
jgi:hypothetical protein